MPDREPGRDLVARILADSVALHVRVGQGDLDLVLQAATTIVSSLRDSGQVLAFGNGGSAADAQHLVAELVGRFSRERRALAAVALTADSSVLTSISNDEGFDRVFARQIEALGRVGDVAFGISTSGASPNVVKGLQAAQARGLRTIALTGRDGGVVGQVADIHLNVPSESTPRVQEVHRTLLHVIADLVDQAFD